MFDPIYQFTGDGFGTFWLTVFVLSNIVMYALSILHFSYKYITMGTPHFLTPFIWMIDFFEKENRKGWNGVDSYGDSNKALNIFFDITAGTFAQLLLSAAILVVLIAAINWLWLPLVIICGYIAFLKGGRAIVSLKRSLDKHMKDKNAHQ